MNLKRIYIICFFLLNLSFCFSQNFSIGPKLGLNQSTLSGFSVPTSNKKAKFSYLAGIVSDTYISDKASIMTEFLFIEKGVSYNGTSYFKNPDFKNVHKFNYFDIASTFKYNFSDRIGVRTGIYYSILQSYYIKTIIKAPEFLYVISNQFPIQNDDFGAVGGVTVGLNEFIFIDLSYRTSLVTLYYLSYRQAYNNTFSLGIRYMFSD